MSAITYPFSLDEINELVYKSCSNYNLRKIYKNKKIVIDAINCIVNYNGELEDNKIDKSFLLGSKKRLILAPTTEYKKFLKKFNIVLRFIFHIILRKISANKNLLLDRNSSTISHFNLNNICYSSRELNKNFSNKPSIIDKDYVMLYNNPIFIKYDIKDAFNSTSYSLFCNLLRNNSLEFFCGNYTYLLLIDVILNKAKYLFINNKLPQGFNTSSIIFNYIQNFIFLKVISKMHKKTTNFFSSKEECNCGFKLIHEAYNNISIFSNRYIDDFVISIQFNTSTKIPENCNNHFNFILNNIADIYKKFGFTLNSSKSRISIEGRTPIKFYGLSYHRNKLLPRKIRRKLKALEHKYKTSQNKTIEFNSYYNSFVRYYNSYKT